MVSIVGVQSCEQIAVTNALFPPVAWVLGLHFSATDVKQRDVAFAVKCHGSFIFILKIFVCLDFNQYLCGTSNSK